MNKSLTTQYCMGDFVVRMYLYVVKEMLNFQTVNDFWIDNSTNTHSYTFMYLKSSTLNQVSHTDEIRSTLCLAN